MPERSERRWETVVAVVAGALVLAPGAPAALPSEPVYRAPQAGVGPNPQDLAAADFDGDGDHDLAVTNSGGASVSIVRNVGGGVLAVVDEVPTADRPRAVAAGDLDRDGAIDLVVGHRGAGQVLVLRGDGAGSFTVDATLPSPVDVADVAVADLNGDDAPDVVVAALASDGLVVRLNDGSGGLEAAGTLPISATGVAVADVDGDGVLDLAVSTTANEVRTLLGRGDGSFAPGETIATPALPWKVAVGDVDGDGDLDLATANFTTFTPDTATIARNLGGGRFSAGRSVSVGQLAAGIAAGDVDGDGRDELVTVSTEGPRSTSIISDDGPGGVSVTRLDGPAAAWGVTLAHMDSGPLLDAVVAGGGLCDGVCPGPGSVTALLNAGRGSLGGHTVHETADPGSSPGCVFVGDPARARAVAAADLTGDGRVDLAVAVCESERVDLLRNDGFGGFVPAGTIARGDRGAAALAAGDVDRDGDQDLVVVYDGWFVVVHRNRGDGSFEAGERFAQAIGQPFVALEDMDGDGAPDVVLGARILSPGGNVAVFRNEGGRFPTVHSSFFEGSDELRAVAVADLDGDGDSDVVTAAERTGTVRALLNDGAGALTARPALELPGAEPAGIAAGDVDGDGDADVAVSDRAAGVVHVLASDGAGGLTPAAALAAGDDVAGVSLADVDVDGRIDLVHAQPTAATHPHENATIRLNEGGRFGDPVSYLAGRGSSVVLVAQLNGAGGPELVVADESDGRLWIHWSGLGGLLRDLDLDLVPDGFELGLLVDPFDPDSDDDGLVDGLDPDLLREAIRRLPRPAFARPGLQQALLGRLSPLDPLIVKGQWRQAVKHLEDVGARFDGCRFQKTADGDDWVRDCEAQRLLALPHALLHSNLRGVPLPQEVLPPPNPQEPAP